VYFTPCNYCGVQLLWFENAASSEIFKLYGFQFGSPWATANVEKSDQLYQYQHEERSFGIRLSLLFKDVEHLKAQCSVHRWPVKKFEFSLSKLDETWGSLH
jgi:hypothetical protein